MLYLTFHYDLLDYSLDYVKAVKIILPPGYSVWNANLFACHIKFVLWMWQIYIFINDNNIEGAYMPQLDPSFLTLLSCSFGPCFNNI